ncbi:MAG: hypothetical protein LBH84_05420, partial [Prevotellaceae bacterium]|nr:hypothetical protein [Prevotellaceae bacterium]
RQLRAEFPPLRLLVPRSLAPLRNDGGGARVEKVKMRCRSSTPLIDSYGLRFLRYACSFLARSAAE